MNLTDDVLLFSQAALGDPQPPTHPAAGVEGAVLDDACSWREVRVEAIDDSEAARPGQHGGGRRRHRPRVPRPQPRAPRGPRGVDPRLARAHARRRGHPRRAAVACRCSWTRRAGRASARRWTYVRAVIGDADDRGTRRGARAPAPGHARGRRRRRAPLRRARGGGRPPGRRARSASRPTSCPPRAPTRSARWRSRTAAATRWGSRAARICAWSRRSRRTSGSARAPSWRSPSPRRWPRCRGATSTRRRSPRPSGRAARSAVGMWTFALGGLVVEGGHAARASSARRRCWRTTRCPTSGGRCSSCPRPRRGCRAAPRKRRSGSSCRRPSGRPSIAQLVLTSLLPALVERELEEFGAALTRVQELVGDSFAAVAGRSLPSARRRRSSMRCCASGRRAPARARGGRRSTASSAARRPGASSRAAWRTSSARAASSSWRSTTAAPAVERS